MTFTIFTLISCSASLFCCMASQVDVDENGFSYIPRLTEGGSSMVLDKNLHGLYKNLRGTRLSAGTGGAKQYMTNVTERNAGGSMKSKFKTCNERSVTREIHTPFLLKAITLRQVMKDQLRSTRGTANPRYTSISRRKIRTQGPQAAQHSPKQGRSSYP